MPTGIKVADTYASFKIEGSRAERTKLERELRSISNVRIGVRLNADVARLRADLAKVRPIRVPVRLDPDWARFRAELATRTFTTNVRVNAVGTPGGGAPGSPGGGGGGAGVSSGATGSTLAFAGAALRASNQSTLLALRIGTITVAATGLIGPVGAAVIVLSNLTVALKGTLGAVAYLPIAFDAAAASIATLVIGFDGIGRAIAEANKQVGAATEDTRDYAREATLAGRSVRSAYESQMRAQKAYSDATREARRTLEDYNLELSELDTRARRASQSVTSAQHALDAALADPTAGPDAIADAELDLEEARQRSTRTAVEGSRTVEDAARAAASGYEGVSATIMDAQWGMRDAAEAISDALYNQTVSLTASVAEVDRYQQAMDKLSPAAQDVVRAILEQRGAWREVQNSISQALLVGVGDDIRRTVATWKAPFTEGMVEVATSMNTVLGELFDWLNKPTTIENFSVILGNVADFVERLAPAFDPFLTAVQLISKEGSTRLPKFADTLTRLANTFGDFISRADSTGALSDFFDRVAASFAEVDRILGYAWPVIRELLHGFATFSEAAGPSAERVFVALADAFANTDWTTIGTAFGGLIEALIPLMPAFADLASTLLPAIFDTLASIATTAMPYILQGLQWISDNPELMAGLLIGFAGLLIALQPLLPLIPVVTGLVTSLLTLIPAGSFLGILTSPAAVAIIGGVILGIAGIATGIATHMPEIKQFFTDNEEVLDHWKEKWGEILEDVNTSFTEFKNGLKAAWDIFWPSLSVSIPQMGIALGDALAGVFQGISGAFTAFAGLLEGDWEKMWNGLSDLVAGAGNAILGAFESFVNGFLGAAHGLARYVEEITNGAIPAGTLPVVDIPEIVIADYNGAHTKLNFGGGSVEQRYVAPISETVGNHRTRSGLQEFAKGGEVFGEQVVMVGDNASGRERITPLDRNGVSAGEREMLDLMRMMIETSVARGNAPLVQTGDVSFRSRDDIDYFRATIADEMARIADNQGRQVSYGGSYDA